MQVEVKKQHVKKTILGGGINWSEIFIDQKKFNLSKKGKLIKDTLLTKKSFIHQEQIIDQKINWSKDYSEF